MQRYRAGNEPGANEKIYAKIHEWFTMLTFNIVGADNTELQKLLEGLLDDKQPYTIHPVTEFKLLLTKEIDEKKIVIRPSRLQNRFIEYLVSEINQRLKEETINVFDTISNFSADFLSRFFCASVRAIAESSNLLKEMCENPLLSTQFANDFGNLVRLLEVISNT